MADEGRLKQLEERYEGYTVYDNAGDKIGKVDELFVDEDDREEYIGVKMGFLGRRSTLIPMDIVRVNERVSGKVSSRLCQAGCAKQHVRVSGTECQEGCVGCCRTTVTCPPDNTVTIP